MIRHVVMWTVRDEADGLDKEGISAKICADLSALKGKIPEIKALSVGASVTHGDMHYDVCLIVDVADLDALKRYDTHPEHLKVRDYIATVRIERVVADIEI